VVISRAGTYVNDGRFATEPRSTTRSARRTARVVRELTRLTREAKGAGSSGVRGNSGFVCESVGIGNAHRSKQEVSELAQGAVAVPS